MGQVGTGCALAGSGITPPTRLTLPRGSLSFWRTLPDAYPPTATPLNMSVDPAAFALLSGAPYSDGHLNAGTSTIAGVVAPCRAACEAHAYCAGFSFPSAGGTASHERDLGPSRCRFWYTFPDGPPVRWAAANGALRFAHSPSEDLHLLEVVGRGGGATAGAGTSHSLLAAALPQAARCPADADGALCGGSSRGACVGGECECTAGWRGEGCSLQACEPSCHPLHGTCA
eukprot:1616808-Prymnesium_polylepis.1